MKRLLSALILASIMLICVSCAEGSDSGKTSKAENSEVSNVISSDIYSSDTESFVGSESTIDDKDNFKKYIEEQLTYVFQNEEEIEEIKISYYKYMSFDEKVIYSTNDKNLITKWVSFLQKAELTYEDCEFGDGASYHTITVTVDGQEVMLERGWNIGRVYVGSNETTMAVISNWEELRSEYDTLFALMSN